MSAPANTNKIDEVIDKIVDLRLLFGLSMQPKTDRIGSDGDGALSDRNILTTWLQEQGQNEYGGPVERFSSSLEKLLPPTVHQEGFNWVKMKDYEENMRLPSGKRKFVMTPEDYNLSMLNFQKYMQKHEEYGLIMQKFGEYRFAMQKLIKASLKTGEFVPGDRTYLIDFFNKNPDILDFFLNNIDSLKTSNEALHQYIIQNKIKILPKSLSESELNKAKSKAQEGLSKAREKLLRKLGEDDEIPEHGGGLIRERSRLNIIEEGAEEEMEEELENQEQPDHADTVINPNEFSARFGALNNDNNTVADPTVNKPIVFNSSSKSPKEGSIRVEYSCEIDLNPGRKLSDIQLLHLRKEENENIKTSYDEKEGRVTIKSEKPEGLIEAAKRFMRKISNSIKDFYYELTAPNATEAIKALQKDNTIKAGWVKYQDKNGYTLREPLDHFKQTHAPLKPLTPKSDEQEHPPSPDPDSTKTRPS